MAVQFLRAAIALLPDCALSELNNVRKGHAKLILPQINKENIINQSLSGVERMASHAQHLLLKLLYELL